MPVANEAELHSDPSPSLPCLCAVLMGPSVSFITLSTCPYSCRWHFLLNLRVPSRSPYYVEEEMWSRKGLWWWWLVLYFDFIYLSTVMMFTSWWPRDFPFIEGLTCDPEFVVSHFPTAATLSRLPCTMWQFTNLLGQCLRLPQVLLGVWVRSFAAQTLPALLHCSLGGFCTFRVPHCCTYL